ncbi:hypothetical protein GQ457_09G012990 [Hibiscus cannabinus]
MRLAPPFPQRLKKQKKEYKFKKFFDILKHGARAASHSASPPVYVWKARFCLPLVEALQQMPNYVKFLKDMVTRKTRIEEFDTAAATEACLAMMHNKVPAKRTDPESFTIPCSIGNHYSGKALCDPGASINLMPKSIFQKLGIGEAKPTTVILQLADRSYVQLEGKIKDILVRVDKLIFPADFLILDLLRVDKQHVKINIFTVLGYQDAVEECKVLHASIEPCIPPLKSYMDAYTEKDKGVVT